MSLTKLTGFKKLGIDAERKNALVLKSAPKPKTYTTIESSGNTLLVKDNENYAYAQDANGNRQSLYYYNEPIKANMWGTYNLLGAEKINGINSLIWENRYDDDNTYYWLSLHDDEWNYYAPGEPGYPGRQGVP